ncbi:MAG: carbon-nitrogen hydrolase family protein [Pseudomonadota bacterium]
MTDRFRAALVQTCTGCDVEQNIKDVSDQIREAASNGAEYVQTPEVTNVIEVRGADQLAKSEPDDDSNRAITAFSALADQLGIWLHIGSMAVRKAEDKLANRAFLFGPDGQVRARYDKIHMFDVDVDSENRFNESRRYDAGDRAVIADLPWGKLGITICYDMRFPALYRSLAKAGAQIIAVPSAFTVPTGEAGHWLTLLRARAIEAQCYVLAAAQAGEHESGRKSYGHSVAIAPWGEILAEADGLQKTVIYADIDMDQVTKARSRVPSLNNDRPFDVTHA